MKHFAVRQNIFVCVIGHLCPAHFQHMQQRIAVAAQATRVPGPWLFAPSRHRPHLRAYRTQPKTLRAGQLMQVATASATQHATSSSEPASRQDAKSAAPDDLVQYIVLRKDLMTSMQWPLGSVIAQACHASTAALWLARDSALTNAYCGGQNLDHMHKVSSMLSV